MLTGGSVSASSETEGWDGRLEPPKLGFTWMLGTHTWLLWLRCNCFTDGAISTGPGRPFNFFFFDV